MTFFIKNISKININFNLIKWNQKKNRKRIQKKNQ